MRRRRPRAQFRISPAGNGNKTFCLGMQFDGSETGEKECIQQGLYTIHDTFRVGVVVVVIVPVVDVHHRRT